MSRLPLVLKFVGLGMAWGISLGAIVGAVVIFVFFGFQLSGAFAGFVIGAVSGVILGFFNGLAMGLVTLRWFHSPNPHPRYVPVMMTLTMVLTFIGASALFSII